MFISDKSHTIAKSTLLCKLKEICFQLLFPRVCPVCGKILKLPSGWANALTYPMPVAPLSKKAVRKIRSILICDCCFPKLVPLSGSVCRKCSKLLFSEEEIFCENCRKGLSRFDEGSALWIHDDAAKKILYNLKFHNKRDNADLIGFELALQMKTRIEFWQAQVLLPVPLHKKRFHQRGFNQAQLIAEKLSFWLEKLYGIRLPVDASYLLRSKNTKPQRTIDAAMRTRNVADAFIVDKKEGRSYQSVILIDDIYTSGSTLNACAEKLKEAGCKQVCFITASIVS